MSRSELAPLSRALVVAEPALARLVALTLRHCGCVTWQTERADEARRLRSTLQPELFLVAMNGDPDRLGLLGPDDGSGAVIALVPEGRWPALETLPTGTDEAARVPFTPDELAVRASGALRRLGLARHDLRHTIVVGDLELSIDERVRLGGEALIELGPAANSLLYVLASGAGAPIPPEVLRRLTWGLEAGTSDRDIDHAVARLEGLLGRRAGITRTTAGFALRAERAAA